jgi:plasmid stability protein
MRNVPDDVHRILTGRAAKNQTSLQDYLLSLLQEIVDRPSREEILDRVALGQEFGNARLSSEGIVAAIREGREGAGAGPR